MLTSRLEAFSDGVMAIIITIMVLDLYVPEGHGLAALTPAVGSGLLSYVLSFVYIGIQLSSKSLFFSSSSSQGGKPGTIETIQQTWNARVIRCASRFPRAVSAARES
ncbi:hypothetical protein GCM10009715_33570 [Paeniglutamicibacter psychrophenolicus]|uniref:Membrane protein n=1 Tax=Paeniglutamicibacter psychrophenolicus TaxID=257454 RepID=A0ABS4W9S0_9MICC|nr:TMEM175 family protein [Paeniglutamicibacter psychrophenolicus]MBP2372944.1 putative membrane protein [Paeniglutamicibacter psychrophenolicus]